MLDISALRPISQGIVAENKARDTDMVSIWPVEIIPSLIDDLTTTTVKRETMGIGPEGQPLDNEDYKGSPYAVSVQMSAVIKAQWLGETNRVTSPDVRRGEQVMLYQAGDSDKYFWLSLGRDDNLRRLETVVYAFNANPDNADADMSRENCYVLEYNTHDKHVTLTTSKANGEPTAYTHQFNTGDGTWTLEDDIGNGMHLDSQEKHFIYRNADKSHIEINKKHIDIYTEETIFSKTETWGLKCDTMNVDAGTINVKAGKIKIDAGKMTIKAPTLWTGGLTIDSITTGALAAAPGTAGSSGSGKVTAAGGIETPKDISCKNITCSHITWSSKSGPI